MPHTSHKKRSVRTKRQEVIGDDGWTRVTSKRSPAMAGALPPSDKTRDGETYTVKATSGETITFHYARIQEAPEGLTESAILDRYTEIEKRWKDSESWKSMENTLQKQVISSNTRVDACVLFGSGTFTGLGQGWINRNHVAMYQLAAFKAVVDLIEQHVGQRPPSYAQEPLYNTQDTTLLSTLGIQKIENPKGFDVLNLHSFAFCPGAEQSVVLRTLSTDPFIYWGGKLDSYRGSMGYLQSSTISYWYETYRADDNIRDGIPTLLSLEEIEELKGEVTDKTGAKLDEAWVRAQRVKQEPDIQKIEHYLRNKEVAKVPDLDDVQDYPVYDTCLYWRVL